MTYCTQCGLEAEPGKNFCPRCGTRFAVTPNTQLPAPPATPPGDGTVHPRPLRKCTKCGLTLEDGILFCPGCGTKNYVHQPSGPRSGELLMTLENCNLLKLQIIKSPGTLYLHDDKLYFQAASASSSLVIPYSTLAMASPQSGIGARYGIKLSCTGGKTHLFSLPEGYADMHHYVISLILDYIQ